MANKSDSETWCIDSTGSWEEPPSGLLILEIIILSCTTGLIIVCNIFQTVVVVLADNELRVPTKIVMTSAGIANLFIALFIAVPLLTSLPENGWILGDYMCVSYAYGLSAWHLCSILSGLTFNVDRYIFLTRPLKYPFVVTTKRTLMSVVGCWVVAMSLSLSDGFVCHWRAEYRCQYYACIFLRSSSTQFKISLTLTILRLSMVLLPLTFTIFSAVQIRIIAIVHKRRIQNAVVNAGGHDGPRRRHLHLRSLKPILLLSTAILFSFLPLVFNSFYISLGLTFVPRGFHYLVTLCTLLYPVGQLFLHYHVNAPFREAVKHLFKRHNRR